MIFFMSDWLTRTELILDEGKLKKLKDSNVLVVGLGGVGAYAAEMICRAGVGAMTIVDGDKIHPTNRNRQLPALKSTEGMAKAEVMGHRILDINPDIKLIVIQEYIKEDRMMEVIDKGLSLIHISEPTRLLSISYAVF